MKYWDRQAGEILWDLLFSGILLEWAMCRITHMLRLLFLQLGKVTTRGKDCFVLSFLERLGFGFHDENLLTEPAHALGEAILTYWSDKTTLSLCNGERSLLSEVCSFPGLMWFLLDLIWHLFDLIWYFLTLNLHRTLIWWSVLG